MAKKTGIGSLLTGLVLGAAAVFFSKEENRKKTVAVAKDVTAQAKKVVGIAKSESKKIVAAAKSETKKIAKATKSEAKRVTKQVKKVTKNTKR